MYFKGIKIRYLLLCVFITFVITCLIGIAPISIDECKCKCDVDEDPVARKKTLDKDFSIDFINAKHRLAIIVPFRDRFDELLTFVPHMNKFLTKQNIYYRIFVVNQVDNYRFNRASLINAGFSLVKRDYDYIAMHDVDLLPINDQLLYNYPEKGPHHVASPELHPRYHYPTFVGGILLVNREHFVLVNGMSNKYWGWGLEDDEFYVRIKEAGLVISRPMNLTTGTQNTFKHIHDRNRRKRDMTKCYNQREVTRRRDRQTGLKDVSYKLEEVTELTITGTPAITVIGISLNCNKTVTPWCECLVKSNGTKDTPAKLNNKEDKKTKKNSSNS